MTGTENAVMAAVLARGATIIRNAACEPHVQDLCNLLCSMGATIATVMFLIILAGVSLYLFVIQRRMRRYQF